MYDRAPREITLANAASTDVHVGPGSYQVPLRKNEASGKNGYAPFLSLAARESTLVTTITEDDAPGPAHYNIRKIKKTPKRFEVFRNVDAPSIPSPGQSHGYYIKNDGSVLKQSPPVVDKTLGPAFYKPLFDASDSTLKYKGVHFGNQSGRQDLPVLEGPGPGDYDILQESTLHYENVNIKKEDKLKSCPFLPRYHEVIVLQEEKKRFVPVKSITPAPGTYNDHRTALETLKKLPGPKNIPFGLTTVRFTHDCSLEDTPGPGCYDIFKKSTSFDYLKDHYMQRTTKSAFGSSVPRTFHSVKEDNYAIPGPADYQYGAVSKMKNLAIYYKMFMCIIPNFIFQDAPPPGHYDVQKSFEKSYGKPKYMPPRTCMARKKHNSFLSSTPRSLEIKKEGPGPASYNPIFKTSPKLSLFLKKEKRFVEPKNITPGPGTYKVY
uniref:Sperm tail PG-rich repeat containing 2 n=1 Tax=Vombatus ursinus TaxID=29139 RepID=A0A4X2JS26_VOMUR